MKTEEKRLSVREKLEKEIGPVDWKVLRPHLLRDAIIIVSPELNLIDVGVKVAEDDSAQIETWISSGQITKPTPQDAEGWEKGGVEMNSIVVSPFVLVQKQRQ